MKNRIAALILSGFVFLATAQAETRLKMSVPFGGATDIQILVSERNPVQLKFEQGTVSAYFNSGASQQIVQGLSADEMLNGKWGIHIDDFNFDGYQDFAIDKAYGYGGANINSTIYAFDPATGRFSKMLEAMNIDIRPQSQELFTGQKSGPRYYTTSYRFVDGKPWKYKDTTSMVHDLELVVLYNQAGQTTQRTVIDLTVNSDQLKAAKRSITAQRARIFPKPVFDTSYKGYLIKGDQVDILDVAGEWDEWLKIRFRGKDFFIDRWMKSEDIAE